MEGRIVFSFVFAMLGIITLMASPQLNQLGTFLVLGGFILIALNRLLLLSLIQFGRLEEPYYLWLNRSNLLFVVVLTIGIFTSKIIMGDNFLSFVTF